MLETGGSNPLGVAIPVSPEGGVLCRLLCWPPSSLWGTGAEQSALVLAGHRCDRCAMTDSCVVATVVSRQALRVRSGSPARMTARVDLPPRRGELPASLEVPHFSPARNCVLVFTAEVLGRRRERGHAAGPVRSLSVALSQCTSPDKFGSLARSIVARAWPSIIRSW